MASVRPKADNELCLITYAHHHSPFTMNVISFFIQGRKPLDTKKRC